VFRDTRDYLTAEWKAKGLGSRDFTVDTIPGTPFLISRFMKLSECKTLITSTVAKKCLANLLLFSSRK